ncbi:hypothetical protein [Rhodopirellula europaea]|uniref:Uncharacterized protein n=1 Tax=Rhodopirellula europaea 6C TaxID=1263867 RepID=M2APK5_9BACT|nr:hypothetical protein [Rhodopirellula europaea]EMB14677.1 hypothetical protein RE6C_04484 [Rhodopirellula europaea 6C]
MFGFCDLFRHAFAPDSSSIDPPDMLTPIELPSGLDSTEIPTEIHAMVHGVKQRIEAFQDRWDRPQIELFVAADYLHVYQTMRWVAESQMLNNSRFVEWGCGFAAITWLAAAVGWDAIGIESEPELIRQGKTTLSDWQETLASIPKSGPTPELVRGNFLPEGSETLAEDPTLPSLGHSIESAYSSIGLDVEDFGIFYSYPWPGEDDFHEYVFHRYAAYGAVMVLFKGPNEMRVWRKTRGRS